MHTRIIYENKCLSKKYYVTFEVNLSVTAYIKLSRLVTVVREYFAPQLSECPTNEQFPNISMNW